MDILWTTKSDLSHEYFSRAGWDVHFYEELDFSNLLSVSDGLVYFRDPFNSPETAAGVPVIPSEKINKLIRNYADVAKSVDHIRSYNDMLAAEDKFVQFERLGSEFMPETYLAGDESDANFIVGQHIAKPRISQRAKDILFELPEYPLDNRWIIQERLDIAEELRIYTIGKQILTLASIKTSKQTGKVKVVGLREISLAEKEFIARALEKMPDLDFAGFDLAITKDKTMKILEVNRSPQFKRYAENTGLNPAELLTK